MNILSEIKQAGLVVSMAGAQLKIGNPSRLTAGLRNLIIANKPEIIKQLTAAQIQHDIRNCLEDKPAVMTGYCYRVTDKPDSILIVNTPGESLPEITKGLQLKYGNRLLEVYPMPTKH